MACCTPKTHLFGPFQINVLRRQEIDYQFYFILSIASLTPPKTKNKKLKEKEKVGFACRPKYTQDKA
jgi:hypothetical protein